MLSVVLIPKYAYVIFVTLMVLFHERMLPKNDSEIHQNTEKKESESVGVQISKKITSEFLMAV